MQAGLCPPPLFSPVYASSSNWVPPPALMKHTGEMELEIVNCR